MRSYLQIMGNIRNTGRVKGGLVNVVGKHCVRVSVVSLVLCDVMDEALKWAW